MPGEPADMHLVDDRLGKRPTEGYVALPIIAARVDDDAPQRRSSVVPWTSRGLSAATRGPGNAFPVRVEQCLAGVEAQSSLGIERSGDTVGVELACGAVWHECVPIMVGAVDPRVQINDPRRLWGVYVVEQQQLRPAAVLGEHAEIDASVDKRRPERKACSPVHLHISISHVHLYVISRRGHTDRSLSPTNFIVNIMWQAASLEALMQPDTVCL